MPSLRAKVPLIELCYPNFLRHHCQSCNLPAESITLHILRGFLNPNWLLPMLRSDLSRIVMKIAGEPGAVINNVASVQTLPLPDTAGEWPCSSAFGEDQTGQGVQFKVESSEAKSSKCGRIRKCFPANVEIVLEIDNLVCLAAIQDV